MIEDYGSEDYVSKDQDPTDLFMDPHSTMLDPDLDPAAKSKKIKILSFTFSYVKFLQINIRFGHIRTCRSMLLLFLRFEDRVLKRRMKKCKTFY
jgi:hypothetical protein